MPSRNNPTTEDRSWFGFVAQTDDAPAEILIYDYIGSYGVTASDFDAELKALGRVSKATMRINSPGGETPTAASIYNMLERWVAKYGVELTVVIDGIAASAASWIAMLGDEVIMPENTLMMIHDPAGFAVGTSRDMRALAAVLDRIKQGMVSAYMKKSGQSKEDIEAIMEAETWYGAQEAVDAGFADRVDNPVDVVASFDLSRFKHPPTPVGSLIPQDSPAVARTRSGASTETPMVTKPNETAAEMETRLRAEITASLAATPVVAAVAAAPAVVAETPAAMEARLLGEITAKHSDIAALCKIAGKPEKAAEYIAQGKTVAQVRDDLAANVAAPRAQNGNGRSMNTHVDQNDNGPLDTPADLVGAPDTNAIWANFNKGKATPFRAQA